MKPLSRPFGPGWSKSSRTILVLTGLALVWRGAFWPVSLGAYTDGILQIDCFRQGLTYWPPLYALLARLFAWVPGVGLEGSGHLIAWLAGALVIPPLAALTTRLFGFRAAFWAILAWLASPLAMQWSLQVMTDMPMTALWTAALAALAIGVEHFMPGLFPQGESAPTPRPEQGIQWLLLASLCGALATLTRYQGILLLGPIVLALGKLTPLAASLERQMPRLRAKLWLTSLPWIVVPLWVLHGGVTSLANHFAQIEARGATGSLGQTLLRVYWYQFEEFVMRAPYFFAYGIFLFMLYGLFRVQWGTARLRWAGWIALFLALAILGTQSIFSSFQSRYLLPLVPLVCMFAGHGLATCERHNDQRRGRLALLAAAALGSALVFSLFVALYQGDPFLDLKQAAQYLVEKAPDLKERRIFSNETFNEKIGAAKLGFWTGGHDILPLVYFQEREGGPILIQSKFKSGDLIVLVSCYGGAKQYLKVRQTLLDQAGTTLLAHFRRSALPLLPDLMQEPDTHQNPQALDWRYSPQYFETSILEIRRSESKGLEPPPAITVPQPSQETRDQIQSLQNQINQLKQTTNTLK